MITEITCTKYVTSLDAGALVTVIENTGGLVTTIAAPGPQGPKGDPGDGIVAQTHEAGTNLSGHRAIRVLSGVAYLCDGTNAAHIGRAIGISTGAAVAGADVEVQTAGLLTEPSWTWADGPVFVGASGVLTQSMVGMAYIHQIGLAVSATQIDINPLSPILIS
jgi:hypothetical protein